LSTDKVFKSSIPVGVANQYAAQMSTLVGGTEAARYFIRLHELGHFFQASGFIHYDGTNIDAQKTTMI
jgi:hypothetical protein